MPPTNPTRPARNAKPDKAAAIVTAVKPRKPGDLPPPEAEEDKDHLVPPENTFWTRYSPNGEALLSPMTSIVIHGLLLGVILIGVLNFFKSKDNVEEIEPVLIGDDTPGGGGGNIMGEDNKAPGNLTKKDEAEELNQDKTVTPTPKEEDAKVTAPAAPTLADDPDAMARIEKAKKQNPNAGIFLKDAFAGVAGKGRGGEGRGGGQGKGVGTGKGDLWGAGPSSKRGRRALRWEILFRTDTHADYLRQLNALGAFIGVPDQAGKLMVIRNLNERPAKPVYESITDVNRVFWVDERADSARGIAELLQLNVIPSTFVAFIPESIEKDLLKVEMDYAKKYGVTKEEDIKATQFSLVFRGGRPAFTIKSQTRK